MQAPHHPSLFSPDLRNYESFASLAARPQSPSASTISIPTNNEHSERSLSDMRGLFQTTETLRIEFAKFLNVIFFQIDEEKFFRLIDEILLDPKKTDQQIYNELVERISTTKKRFPFLSQLKALFVLKHSVGVRVKELLKPFVCSEFKNYVEVSNRRYKDCIEKAAGLKFTSVTAVCDSPAVNLAARIEAGVGLGTLFFRYPYKSIPLNDAECKNPLLEPEKTSKPLGDEIEDQSVDLMTIVAGLHHVPPERLEAFMSSVSRKVKKILILGEHDCDDRRGKACLPKEVMKLLALWAHRTVNISAGVSWEVDNLEIRNFQSQSYWRNLVERHGFTRISSKELVLANDPTENGLTIYEKTPTNLNELEQSMHLRVAGNRPNDGSSATWIEFGNVRYSREVAEYKQNHHECAVNWIGYLKEHWKHFYYYLKESLNDDQVSLKSLFFSNNMAMNLFILTASTVECSSKAVSSILPAAACRLYYGKTWRNLGNLTSVERALAQHELEYSKFIQSTPFYQYPYVAQINNIWASIWNSDDRALLKAFNALDCILPSLQFLMTAGICAPVRWFYTSEANIEPDTICMIINDPINELVGVISRWEIEKKEEDSKCHIEVIHTLENGYKLVSMPRYLPLTQICRYIAYCERLEIINMAGQRKVSVDVLVDKDELIDEAGIKFVYSLPKQDDLKQRHHKTYQVMLSSLKHFQRSVGLERIEYIHE